MVSVHKAVPYYIKDYGLNAVSSLYLSVICYTKLLI